jgi:hypothetical protein
MKGKSMHRANKRVRRRTVHIPTLPAGLSDASLLSRRQAALWLSENGAPVAPQRLAILATTGNGPSYCLLFGKARYRVADLRDWLDRLTGARFTSAADRFEHQRRVKQQGRTGSTKDMFEDDNNAPSTATNPASSPPKEGDLPSRSEH